MLFCAVYYLPQSIIMKVIVDLLIAQAPFQVMREDRNCHICVQVITAALVFSFHINTHVVLT